MAERGGERRRNGGKRLWRMIGEDKIGGKENGERLANLLATMWEVENQAAGGLSPLRPAY